MSEIETKVNSPFTPEQVKLLNTPLRKDEIDLKEGKTRYLKHHVAVEKANKIFGFGNWGYQISSEFEIHDTGKTTKSGNKISLIGVQVTLTVRGCYPITEWGDCVAMGENDSSWSMAKKGAVTDGMKRCLKNFGPALGQQLYDDDWKPEAAPQVAEITDKQLEQLIDLATTKGVIDELEAKCQEHYKCNPNRLNTKQAAQLLKSISNLPTPQAANATPKTNLLANAEMLETIRNTASDKGITGDRLEARCKELYGVALNKLTDVQAEELLGKLKALKDITHEAATPAPQLNFTPANGDDAAAARALVVNGGYDHKLKYDQFTSWFKELTPKGIPADKFGAEMAGIFGAASVKQLLDAMGKAELQDRFRLVLLEYIFYRNANPGKTTFAYNWDSENGIPVDVTEQSFNQVFGESEEIGAA